MPEKRAQAVSSSPRPCSNQSTGCAGRGVLRADGSGRSTRMLLAMPNVSEKNLQSIDAMIRSGGRRTHLD
ncbi:MAG TPA: hypothetical protein VIK01_28160 [Polyangiaceae bacterium]